jgi:hypothetical protein
VKEDLPGAVRIMAQTNGERRERKWGSADGDRCIYRFLVGRGRDILYGMGFRG